jgi:DNA-binding PadR family transcriptional regulator
MWESLCEHGLAESYRNDGSMIFFSVTESGIRELEKVMNEQIEETP